MERTHLNVGIPSRYLLKSKAGSLGKCAHIAEFHVVRFQDLILVPLPECHKCRHVNFIERCQRSSGVLALLQPLRNSLPHPVHLHARLTPITNGGSLFGDRFLLRRLWLFRLLSSLGLGNRVRLCRSRSRRFWSLLLGFRLLFRRRGSSALLTTFNPEQILANSYG